MAERGHVQDMQQSEPLKLDATSLILEAISPLCANGLPAEKVRYFEAKVRKVVAGLVETLMDQVPDKPELAALLWLGELCGLPSPLAIQLRTWAEARGAAAAGAGEAGRGGGGPAKPGRPPRTTFFAEPEPPAEPAPRAARSGSLVDPVRPDSFASFGGKSEVDSVAAPKAKAHAKRGFATWHQGNQGSHLSAPVGRCLATTVSEAEERGENVSSMESAEQFSLLRKLAVFEKLDDKTLEDVNSNVRITKFLEGEDVMKIGEKSEGLHVVLSGEGKVSIVADSGKYSVGDTFGYRQLLDGEASGETVEAWGGPLTTLYLPASSFFTLGLQRQLRTGMRRRSARAAARRGEEHAQFGSPSPGARASVVDGVYRERACSRVPLHDTDRQLIQGAIQANANLGELLNLTERQLERICQVARLAFFVEGQAVFQRGAQGDTFYVVQEGIFQVTDAESLNGCEKGVALRAGDSFGELALLYDTTRAATVTCIRNGSLWAISRAALRSVLKLSVDGRIQEYRRLISGVEGLSWLNEDDKAVICEALEEMCFIKGECIVNQGAEADSFYIVLDGTCTVKQDDAVRRGLGKGDSFGERALLTNDVRSATVEVTSDACTVLVLDRDVFRLLWEQPHSPSEAAAMAERTPQPPPTPPPTAAGDGQHGGNRARREMERRVMQRLKGQPGSRRSVLGQPGSEHIPRTRLERCGVLGRGSFGFVSLERDTSTRRLYALKAMSKGHIARERLKDAVLNEKACMQLLDSDFIVRLYAAYQDAVHLYLLLEVCSGGELFDLFDKHVELFGSSNHARFYAGCVALALEHMHDRRVVYRDLKLENCLLTQSGYLKLTDMGLAKVLVGKTYTICGTTDYFAPETLRQTGHNRAVDWWALGVMIFIMMIGRAPFDAPDAMATYKKIIKGFSKVVFPDTMPPACVSLVLALCKKKPEERITMGSLGVQNLKDQAWYNDFAWRKLQDMTMPAPPTLGASITSEEDFLASARSASFEPLCGDDYEDDGDWPEDFVSC